MKMSHYFQMYMSSLVQPVYQALGWKEEDVPYGKYPTRYTYMMHQWGTNIVLTCLTIVLQLPPGDHPSMGLSTRCVRLHHASCEQIYCFHQNLCILDIWQQLLQPVSCNSQTAHGCLTLCMNLIGFRIEPDLRQLVYCAGIANDATTANFQTVMRLYQQERTLIFGAIEKKRLAFGLTCTKQQSQMKS